MTKRVLEKLHFKPGYRAIVLNAPGSYKPILSALPDGVELADTLDGSFDFIHVFAIQKAELDQRVPAIKSAMKSISLLWVSYPKGKSIPTDLNRDILARELMKMGLQAVAQVAIDDVWSALRFKLV